MEARGKSVAKLDTESAISNAELRLMTQPVISSRHASRKSMANLLRRAPPGDVEEGDGGQSFVARFATMVADDGACSKYLLQLLPWLIQQTFEPCECPTVVLVLVGTPLDVSATGAASSLLTPAVQERMRARRKSVQAGPEALGHGRKRNLIDLSSFGKGLVVDTF
eukprot:COSAG02_NODE_198_length_29564_cov_12.279009_22_plen_166_part_00